MTVEETKAWLEWASKAKPQDLPCCIKMPYSAARYLTASNVDLAALGFVEMTNCGAYYLPCPEHEPVNPWLVELDPVKVKEYCDAQPNPFPVIDLKVLLT